MSLTQSINELMNDEGVCRTALATPVLLNIQISHNLPKNLQTIMIILLSKWTVEGLIDSITPL